MTGLDAAAIGDLAAGAGIAVHALVPRQASLEDAYLDLTGESTDYRGRTPVSAPSLATRALDLLGSEWTKFRSVRSTYWSLLVAVVTPIAVSAVVAFAFANAPGHGPPPDPLLPEVISLEYAVIAVSVLGVLAFSAEYSTGLIQVTFTAAPRRRAVLAAKAVVLAAVTLAAGEVVAFVSFGLVQAVLAGHSQGVSLGHPGVPGAVLSAGLLLCVCALLGLALGAIIRHTAGGIAATIAVILVPGIVALLPPRGTAGSAGSRCWRRPSR